MEIHVSNNIQSVTEEVAELSLCAINTNYTTMVKQCEFQKKKKQNKQQCDYITNILMV